MISMFQIGDDHTNEEILQKFLAGEEILNEKGEVNKCDAIYQLENGKWIQLLSEYKATNRLYLDGPGNIRNSAAGNSFPSPYPEEEWPADYILRFVDEKSHHSFRRIVYRNGNELYVPI